MAKLYLLFLGTSGFGRGCKRKGRKKLAYFEGAEEGCFLKNSRIEFRNCLELYYYYYNRHTEVYINIHEMYHVGKYSMYLPKAK